MEDIAGIFKQFAIENGCSVKDIEKSGDYLIGCKEGKQFCRILDYLENKGYILVQFVDYSKSKYIESDLDNSEYALSAGFADGKYIIEHRDRHDGSLEIKRFDSFMDVLRYTKQYVYRHRK